MILFGNIRSQSFPLSRIVGGLGTFGISKRGIKVLTPELRKGDWVKHDGQYAVVHSATNQFSGRGTRSYNIQLKPVSAQNIETYINLRPTANESFEKLELRDTNAEFLYEADDIFHFNLPQTYEEIEVPKEKVDVIAIPFLATGTKVRIRFLDEEAIIVKLASKSVPCIVKEILSSAENSKGAVSLALLENGMKVSCPGFVKSGDTILIDSEEGSYSGRA